MCVYIMEEKSKKEIRLKEKYFLELFLYSLWTLTEVMWNEGL